MLTWAIVHMMKQTDAAIVFVLFAIAGDVAIVGFIAFAIGGCRL